MAQRSRHRGPTLLGFAGGLCLLIAGPGARADTFQDIQKAILQAEKDFRENRPGDALKQLSGAIELIKTFTPVVKDYIHEAYYWIHAKEPNSDLALKAIANALAKNPKAAEAYFKRGFINRRKRNLDAAFEDLKKADRHGLWGGGEL
jgi:hypothetical protein